MSIRLFAVTLPGLEPFLRQELSEVGPDAARSPRSRIIPARPGGEESGGVAFEAGMTDMLRANLHLRSANRILLRLGDFYAGTFSELRSRAAKLPWEQYIKPGQTVALRVTCHKSKLYHSGGVAERVAGAIQDRLGKPVQVVKFDEDLNPVPQLVVVRLFLDQCEISLDTSGALLHRRGYRLETAKAPLRETLAAALLLASGWDGTAALIDPFCGSGTIPIEAALMAGRIAPGKKRNFAFMGWPGYDSKLWNALLKEALAGGAARPQPHPGFGPGRRGGAHRPGQCRAGGGAGADRVQLPGIFGGRAAARAGLDGDQPALRGAGQRGQRSAQPVCPAGKCAAGGFSGLGAGDAVLGPRAGRSDPAALRGAAAPVEWGHPGRDFTARG